MAMIVRLDHSGTESLYMPCHGYGALLVCLCSAFCMYAKTLYNNMCGIYVTVHAKSSLVRTKMKIHFLAQLIATLNSYLHSMSPMARLNRSAFLGVTECIDRMALIECTFHTRCVITLHWHTI